MAEQAKHTPGPLNVMEGRTLLHVETDIDHPEGAGIPICSLPKNRRGDAALYAAAPDLLEALKAALAHHILTAHAHSRDGHCDIIDELETVKQYRAAIAKPEGR